MKKSKKMGLFIVEVLIPFIAAPLIPYLITGCTEGEGFLIGSCISIFLAVWALMVKLDEQYETIQSHDRDMKRGFNDVDDRVYHVETLLDFEESLENVSSPYFRKRLDDSLRKVVTKFKEDNRDLFEGRVVTNPYSVDTYGANGLRWTDKEILAVSSVSDYWDRKEFVSEYLHTQFELIEDKAVTIKRIFVGTKDVIEHNKELMKLQKDGNIDVYYIITDSEFCNPEWQGQDFLIQDRKLVVDLHINSHKVDNKGEEIITIRDIDVREKYELFCQMLNNSTKYNG